MMPPDELQHDGDLLRLHRFSRWLVTAAPAPVMLEELLDAVMAVQRSDLGTMQLCHARSGALELVAQRGFQDTAAEVLDRLGTHSGVCLERQQRLEIEDIHQDSAAGDDHQSLARALGYHALQSTPLLRTSGQPLGVLALYFRDTHCWTGRERLLTDTLAGMAAAVLERHRLETERLTLLHEVMTTQELERQRVSRDLHDKVGQHLAGLALGLNELASAPGDQAKVRPLVELTESIGREIHDLAAHLRPTVLDDLGLVRALSNYVAGWSARAGVDADFQAVGWDDLHPPAPVENALYRIVVEALSNVLKHAQATRVSVILERRDHQLLAIVEDNGRGLTNGGGQGPAPGLGIVGMRERAALLGGGVTIESTTGRGTTVFVHVPGPAGT